MRLVFWRVWFERYLRDLGRHGDPYAYWLTVLAVIILVLTFRELVCCRRRYGSLVLLNIVFLASIALTITTEITYWSTHFLGPPPESYAESLADATLQVFPYALGWFYISYISLLLLLLSVVVGKIRKKPKRDQEA